MRSLLKHCCNRISLCGALERASMRSAGQLITRHCGPLPQFRYFSDLSEKVKRLRIDINISKLHENVETLQHRQKELQLILEKENTWDDTKVATQLSQELSSTTLSIEYFNGIDEQINSVMELSELATEENDEELMNECSITLDDIEKGIRERRLTALLSSEQDQSGCYLEIVAGTGGSDAFHWTKMLANMYTKWASKSGYVLTYIDEQPDDSAGGVGGGGGGYRRVTLRVEGDRAYGWLRAEAGLHRLVRKSPFDPSGKRHTSFAQVLLYPVPSSDSPTSSSIEIKTTDLKIDTFKSRGAGGQSVNTTDSAVRITHVPTGIVVTCQNERSQHQNKATAMKVLKAKLWKVHLETVERDKKLSTIGQGDNSWGGNQIRSVVLHPYRLVKDSRSGWETGDVDAHLAGELLSGAMEAFHLQGGAAVVLPTTRSEEDM